MPESPLVRQEPGTVTVQEENVVNRHAAERVERYGRARHLEPDVSRRSLITLRAGLAPELLTNLFSGLIKAALEMTTSGRVGAEEASAAVVAVFLDGTRA